MSGTGRTLVEVLHAIYDNRDQDDPAGIGGDYGGESGWAGDPDDAWEHGPVKPLCFVASCNRDARSLGLCQAHYQQFNKHGRITNVEIRAWRRPVKDCVMDDCNNPGVYTSSGLCKNHYEQQRRKKRERM